MDDHNDTPNESTLKEKRAAPRHVAAHMALLKVSELLQGRGCTKNISRDGMLVQTNNLFRFIHTNRIRERIGSHIKVVFSEKALVVEGRITRINILKGEVAISLRKFSDRDAWEDLLQTADSPGH